MKTVTGDLIELASNGAFDVIVHGCNCFHVAGAGLARQIRTVFPEAHRKDCLTPWGLIEKLGTISFHNYGNLIVVNAYTQFSYGYYKAYRKEVEGRKIHCDYAAIRSCFMKIRQLWGHKEYRFGIPMIGAGLAGGEWPVIGAIIEDEMKGEDLTLVEYEK